MLPNPIVDGGWLQQGEVLVPDEVETKGERRQVIRCHSVRTPASPSVSRSRNFTLAR